jgi:hypothetical protein
LREFAAAPIVHIVIEPARRRLGRLHTLSTDFRCRSTPAQESHRYSRQRHRQACRLYLRFLLNARYGVHLAHKVLRVVSRGSSQGCVPNPAYHRVRCRLRTGIDADNSYRVDKWSL